MPAPTAPLALPLPPGIDPARDNTWAYAPDQATLPARALAWRREHGLASAGGDRRRVHLLIIDAQKDFCHPEGSLYVGGRSGTGASDDTVRLAAFVYRNLAALSAITATLDSHYAFQIFAAPFWEDQDGAPLEPFRVVAADDVRAGRLRPRRDVAAWLWGGDYASLHRQAAFYCAELERTGKYQLFLWPPHCLLGSAGHALAGVVHEARLFHSYARGAQSWVEIKGGNFLTENYSVLRPEVLTRFDGVPLAQKSARFLEKLLGSDAVVIAGQAASHCVKSTIEDLLAEIVAVDPALARKVYLLADCMSAVAIPDGQGGFAQDYTAEAEAALARFADAGMHVVRSTDPLESWPELRLG